ncbi:MAG: hypothetical protein Ct9H300mP1_11580 [Planctomycetaceae bacterium]|nr:MAG: hypothetical protein Ct9H300mP1_11580 [Planctomycetaceae bacterium]
MRPDGLRGKGGVQNFHVRLNVAYLLGELVVRKGDPAKGIPLPVTPGLLLRCAMWSTSRVNWMRSRLSPCVDWFA